MTRRRASRTLYALDSEAAALEGERRALEIEAFGAEATDAERRYRYFAIADVALRRKLIGLERSLHDVRQRRRDAAVKYWTIVATETRGNLAALTSESLTSAWWQGIWWDIATMLWILGGAGWLTYQIPGAAVGTAATGAAAWFIVRRRKRTRPALIRQGQEVLRSSERELQLAEQDATPAASRVPVFSEREAETGLPDAAG